MIVLRSQPYYETVEIGAEIPALEKHTNNVQLFLYSAITRNAHRIHYDQPHARWEGYPDILVHGPLQGAFMSQLLTDWMGPAGFLKKISYSNRGSATPANVLTCKGKVTGKYKKDGEHFVECEIWEENEKGEILLRGNATVRLPLGP